MCEFYGSNGNGFGDIWWTDNPIYFSSTRVYRYFVMSDFSKNWDDQTIHPIDGFVLSITLISMLYGRYSDA